MLEQIRKNSFLIFFLSKKHLQSILVIKGSHLETLFRCNHLLKATTEYLRILTSMNDNLGNTD